MYLVYVAWSAQIAESRKEGILGNFTGGQGKYEKQQTFKVLFHQPLNPY